MTVSPHGAWIVRFFTLNLAQLCSRRSPVSALVRLARRRMGLPEIQEWTNLMPGKALRPSCSSSTSLLEHPTPRPATPNRHQSP